tara:strand:- start:325 stop:975 length:651 start_codon:yes stop_codon:yes gene_type:complete
MKWIGQYIQDFTSRFRNDVYLESISSGTIASGGNLGLDSNNKIVKADEASGGGYIVLDSGSHYLNTITADEWYFGNNSFGRNYHYWNNVKASIASNGATFTMSEDYNLIGRLIPQALSAVTLQISARPSGGTSTGEILSACIISCDRDGAGANTTWTVLNQGEITQVQGEYDGVDITYTGSVATSKMLAVGVGSSEASSIGTTNTRFTYTLTGTLA